jgi:hypothetical protein
MKKFLTLLFAFTCLAFSEMRGQVRLSVSSPNFNQIFEMSSIDENNFSVTVSIPFVQDFIFRVLIPFQYYNTFESFPNGIAVYGGGQYINVPNGTYLIQYNLKSREFSFIGGSYKIFNECGVGISSCNKLSVFLNTSFTNFKWKRNGEIIPGANNSEYIHPVTLPEGTYIYTCEAFSPDSGAVLTSNTVSLSTSISLTAQFQNASDFCSNRQFSSSINLPLGSGWSYQWKMDGQAIPYATKFTYNAPPQLQNASYSFVATCPNNNASKESNSLAVPGCFGDSTSGINYLLVQNVITTGNNASNKTIQVQFDLSWGNTWWDEINWDAAWVFMKYKTAAGEWKHAKINPTGYDHGQGSPNIIQPTSDKLGAFIRLGLKGQGNFNAEGMQLQWNYGLDGLNSVNGLEVKVFAVDMVYIPEGGFFASDFSMTGGNLVVNQRLSPKFSGNYRIKGDAGVDENGDGQIDNSNYPTGFYPFYVYKKPLSRQQFSDFLNCLSAGQLNQYSSIAAGNGFVLNSGLYYHPDPYGVFSPGLDFALAYADWSGMRPLSQLEKNKLFNGAFSYQDNNIYGVRPSNSTEVYGQPYPLNVNFFSPAFSKLNGDGIIGTNGSHDIASWSGLPLNDGIIRLCRSAE